LPNAIRASWSRDLSPKTTLGVPFVERLSDVRFGKRSAIEIASKRFPEMTLRDLLARPFPERNWDVVIKCAGMRSRSRDVELIVGDIDPQGGEQQ
jgi:hypothetical protein